MLVITLKSGFTVGNKLYKEGDLFVLSTPLLEAFGDLSDAALVKKQTKLYGAVFFRRLSPDELKQAFEDKKLTYGMLDAREKKILGEYSVSKYAKKLQAAKVLRDDVDIEIEPAEEEEPSAVEEEPAEEVVEEPKEEAVEEKVEEAPAEKAPPAKKSGKGSGKNKKK